jgi:hypothetical protein
MTKLTQSKRMGINMFLIKLYTNAISRGHRVLLHFELDGSIYYAKPHSSTTYDSVTYKDDIHDLMGIITALWALGGKQ